MSVRLERFRCRGFGPFSGEFSADLTGLAPTDRLVAVCGENGAGKTTFLELFGEAARASAEARRADWLAEGAISVQIEEAVRIEQRTRADVIAADASLEEKVDAFWAAKGYRKAVTFTRLDEPGTSLRAAGFVDDGLTREQSWDRPRNPRARELSQVRRWVRTLQPKRGRHG